MPVPSRQEALSTLRQGHERMAELLARLSGEELARPATIGGGAWSAKDLMGHIALWEEVALVTLEAWLRGVKPAIEETFGSREVDQINALNQERKKSWSLERVRNESEEAHRSLVSAIDAMTDEQWASPPRFELEDEKETLGAEVGGVLGAPGRPFGHFSAHLPDLEDYVGAVAAS